jgi:hypothetical protein
VGFAHALPTLQGLIRRNLPVDAADAEVFDFEEFLDAVFRAPVTRQMGRCAFLEGGDLASGFRRDDALVDADDAVFEGLGDAPDAAGDPPSLPSPASGEG